MAQEEMGSIRGIVIDEDFESPIGMAKIEIAELAKIVNTQDQGNFVFMSVAPGTYTLVFSKLGYVRRVRANVVVTPGKLTDIRVSLAGEYTDLEEFVVQDIINLSGGSEAGLLQLRFNAPALLDSISSDLMNRAGASDAAGALRLVAGASVSEENAAVIRGLPDRYVSSQMNGVRLPSSDDKKRAIQLDQFPAAVIESIQVSKTFTPDQQGDASGGAVNIRLKSIPEQPFFMKLYSQWSVNSQVGFRDDFKSYAGGGLSFWGKDDGGRDQQTSRLGDSWLGAVGVKDVDSPIDYKWQANLGGSIDVNDSIKIGGFAGVFYERDSSFDDKAKDNNLWVESAGAPLTPRAFQGAVQDGDFKTGLFDITKASRQIQWGFLGSLGVEISEKHKINLTYLFSRTTDDTAILAEDTRGKQTFFPGYDPNDPSTPGHSERDAAPYLRLETLEYVERETDTLQLHGEHTIPIGDFEVADFLSIKEPIFDWTVALSTASRLEPDKRQFGSVWYPQREPIPGFVIPAEHRQFKPAANFTLGNLQRIYRKIEELSTQYAVNLKVPFTQWNKEEGFLKLGYFSDSLERKYRQDSFSNFSDPNQSFQGPFNQFWSAQFPAQNHPITASDFDVDYDGTQDIRASYFMLSLPITKEFKLIGGVRFESTKLGITNSPDADATWFPPGSLAPTALDIGDSAADVDFEREDILPSIAFEYSPIDTVTFRGSFNKTIARQTFRELSPILQQEFLGGPIFLGNPNLGMSTVKNYDLRLDYRPYEGGLISFSWFRKDLIDPIEFVQRVGLFNFTTAVNYPEGRLTGVELETRHELGQLWDRLEGLSIGANATFIKSRVSLPQDEIDAFADPSLGFDIRSRDMTNAPEYLFNIYLTYDKPDWGSKFALFYTVQGDTLVVGAGANDGNFIPDIYQTRFGTLNFSYSQEIVEGLTFKFEAKNLTNEKRRTVYRSDFVLGGDAVETSGTRGIEFTFTLSGIISF